MDTHDSTEGVIGSNHEPVSRTLARCGNCDRLYSFFVNPRRCPACGDPRTPASFYRGP